MKYKAIFMDYTGTMVQESGKELQQIIQHFCTNSDLHDVNKAISYVWKLVKKFEKESYLDDFITEDDIVDRILNISKEEYNLRGDFEKLHFIWQRYWVNAPLFEDVKEFFHQCPIPIYVITNDGIKYIEESMKIKELQPAGIISGDMVRAYKPHREIFEKALEISGCQKEEVLHIGDSLESDVNGAIAVGITPVLIDRSNKIKDSNVEVVHSLLEVLELLNKNSI